MKEFIQLCFLSLASLSALGGLLLNLLKKHDGRSKISYTPPIATNDLSVHSPLTLYGFSILCLVTIEAIRIIA